MNKMRRYKWICEFLQTLESKETREAYMVGYNLIKR